MGLAMSAGGGNHRGEVRIESKLGKGHYERNAAALEIQEPCVPGRARP